MADPRQVEEKIRAGIAGADVKVQDPMNDGQHLHATVIAEAFEGKLPLQRHRMVYAALGEIFKKELHALQLETLAPSEVNDNSCCD